jgi:phosphatidylserine decarboxylase
MRLVKDGYPLIFGSLALFVVLGFAARGLGLAGTATVLFILAAVAVAFFVYFFRDPDRMAPGNEEVIVSGADGVVRAIEPIREDRYLQADTTRISIFLNPFDVHVNRAPIGGTVKGLAYTPGKHLLTISNASSEYNEHSSILIEGSRTRCLVKQIVGPVVRRVVYWLELEQALAKGDRIGMMKFGSRMDIYLPAADVEVVVKKGDRVRAGETVIATLRKENA